MVNLYNVLDAIKRDAELTKTQRKPDHARAGGMLSAAARLETALNAQLVYACGERPKEGDIVVSGGDEFRVDRIDYRRGVIKGAVDPVGYVASACVLIKRG